MEYKQLYLCLQMVIYLGISFKKFYKFIETPKTPWFPISRKAPILSVKKYLAPNLPPIPIPSEETPKSIPGYKSKFSSNPIKSPKWKFPLP